MIEINIKENVLRKRQQEIDFLILLFIQEKMKLFHKYAINIIEKGKMNYFMRGNLYWLLLLKLSSFKLT